MTERVTRPHKWEDQIPKSILSLRWQIQLNGKIKDMK